MMASGPLFPVRVIGRGGFDVVYLCIVDYPDNGSRVAVKVSRPRQSDQSLEQYNRWLATHKMTSRQLLDYFWRRVTQQVLPTLPPRADGRDRQVGVWFCDKENLDGNGLYPPPPLGTLDLPPNTLANVHPIPPTFRL